MASDETVYDDVSDLAARLRVGKDYVYDRCAARAWPHHRVGKLIRFTPEDVTEILALLREPVLPRPSHLSILRARRTA